MTNKDINQTGLSEPVNADYAGSINICGVEIQCFVTEDGRRILDCEGVNALFKAMEDGVEMTEEDALQLAQLSKGFKVMEKKK